VRGGRGGQKARGKPTTTRAARAARVWRARLDETELEELKAGASLKLKLGPYKVETLKLEF